MGEVSSRKLTCWAITALIMLAIGLTLLLVADTIIISIMEEEMIMVPGAALYDSTFLELPVPLFYPFWIFNLTNPKEWLQGGPARVEQVGPYGYLYDKKKENLSHFENGTVAYRAWREYTFDPENSVGPESDRIIVPNVIALAVAKRFENEPDGVQKLWELFHDTSEADLLLEMTVGEFMSGYEDPYLKHAQELFGEEAVPITEFGVLALFGNGSYSKFWNVYTGETSLDNLTQVDLYDREPILPWWTTDYANMLNGTDGTFFHPYIDQGEDLYVYSSAWCRASVIKFENYEKVFGVWTYKYIIPPSVWAHPDQVPDNIDFCTPDQTTCPPAGLLNCTECFAKLPIFISLPHFLYGDEKLFWDVTGLNPSKEEHEINLFIDALSGSTFLANTRAQASLWVQPYDYIPGTENLRSMYFPLIWFNMSGGITEEYGQSYHNYLVIPHYAAFSLEVLLITMGGGILIGLLSFYFWRMCNRVEVIEMEVKKMKP